MAAAVFAIPFAAGAGVAFVLYGDHDHVGGVTIDRLPFVSPRSSTRCL